MFIHFVRMDNRLVVIRHDRLLQEDEIKSYLKFEWALSAYGANLIQLLYYFDESSNVKINQSHLEHYYHAKYGLNYTMYCTYSEPVNFKFDAGWDSFIKQVF